MPDIIVIGSGVIGLSAALNLQESGYQVGIFTRDLPQSTTSVAAGALWSASKLDGRLRRWADITLKRFLPLTEVAGSGVTMQRFREVFTEVMPEPWYRDQVPYYQRIDRQDLPNGMRDGHLIEVPIVAPPIYLQNLQDQFMAAGGTIETRTVQSLATVADEAKLLVNCSGVGARDLAHDEAVYPIRGQTMLIDAPHIGEGYMDDSEVVHIFPRADGVLIGGIKWAQDWEQRIDPEISSAIVEKCARIEPSVADAKVLRQFSGLRPGRQEVRLEVEALSSDCRVIHNYGHAAIGYTLSWGCAEQVLALARGIL